MDKVLRTLVALFCICIALVLICGIVASLSHLEYIRPEWSDIAFGWGFAAGAIGLLTFFFAFFVVAAETDNDR